MAEANGAVEPVTLRVWSAGAKRLRHTLQEPPIHRRAVPVDDAGDAAHEERALETVGSSGS